MFIHVFLIDEKAEVTISQVYAKDRISAMIHLELILGCNEFQMDYIGIEETTDPLNYDELENEMIKLN